MEAEASAKNVWMMEFAAGSAPVPAEVGMRWTGWATVVEKGEDSLGVR